MFTINSDIDGLVISALLLIFTAFILVVGTPFLLVSICFTMLRTALGAPQTPPNFVLYGIALAVTYLIVQPYVFESIDNLNDNAYFFEYSDELNEKYSVVDRSLEPYKGFLLQRIGPSHDGVMTQFMSEGCLEDTSTCKLHEIIPAFMMSELKVAFELSYKIFLPFILIDFIISTILLALGMMMMPPTTISLPLKFMFFFYVDGWQWVSQSIIGVYS